jgi:cysteinyl-tRNA synthetase
LLQFYNTLTQKREPFKEINPGEVRLYTCGPTVYAHAHIGNFRTFMFEDLLRRYLKYKGYKLIQVMNITDIDDKTIRDSQKAGVSLAEFTQKYTKAFFRDLDALLIERAESYPKATDHIAEMIAMIQSLVEKGFTYEADGSVYFSIKKFVGYGKLSHINIDLNQTGHRYETDEYEKDDVRDFVLWKKHKEGEPFWESPWGKGRPGWHIECSAMSQKYLGQHFDIHTGGIDNMFPHHENEIAQSEAACGQKFVNYWLHAEHLMHKKDKMSKSLGNIATVRDLIKDGWRPRTLRYFLLSAHYRSPLVYDGDELAACEKALARIDEFVSKLGNQNAVSGCKVVDEKISSCRKSFVDALDDDLNISGAFAALFTFIKELNPPLSAELLSPEESFQIKNFLAELNKVLGFIDLAEKREMLPHEIEALIAERAAARAAKDFARSDAIRDQLLARGIILKDTPQGVRWEKKS